jgi:Ser-tRNA(Ala) deacylase AlaX
MLNMDDFLEDMRTKKEYVNIQIEITGKDELGELEIHLNELILNAKFMQQAVLEREEQLKKAQEKKLFTIKKLKSMKINPSF